MFNIKIIDDKYINEKICYLINYNTQEIQPCNEFIECLYILLKNINISIDAINLKEYLSVINKYYYKFKWENRTKFFILSIIEYMEININMLDKDNIVKATNIRCKNKKKHIDTNDVKDNNYMQNKNSKFSRRFKKKMYSIDRRVDDYSKTNKTNLTIYNEKPKINIEKSKPINTEFCSVKFELLINNHIKNNIEYDTLSTIIINYLDNIDDILYLLFISSLESDTKKNYIKQIICYLLQLKYISNKNIRDTLDIIGEEINDIVLDIPNAKQNYANIKNNYTDTQTLPLTT